MIERKINISKANVLDPVRIDQQSFYQVNGLTATSNNTKIIPRDLAGNIVLQESGSNNPLLIIEPVATTILLKSVLKVLDTRFEYFKFPVSTAVTTENDELLNIDIENDIVVLDNLVNDKLTIPIELDEMGQPNNFARINTSYNSNWFYGGTRQARGYRELTFTGGNQPIANSYTLTEDIINTLRNNQQTLKFNIQTQFVHQVTNTEWALIGITGDPAVDGIVKIILTRTNAESGPRIFDLPEFSLKQQEYPLINMEYILDPNDMRDGDTYTISATSGIRSFIIKSTAFWKIETVDLPTNASVTGDLYGVYNVNNGVSLSININDFNQATNVTERIRKTFTPDEIQERLGS
jgi:hypothetical protein